MRRMDVARRSEAVEGIPYFSTCVIFMSELFKGIVCFLAGVLFVFRAEVCFLT